MNVLFTTPIIEYPAAGGPQLRIENSIKALANISDVFLVSRVSKSQLGGEPAISFYQNIAKEFSFAPSANIFNRYLKVAERKFSLIGLNVFCKPINTILELNIKRDVSYLLKIVKEKNIDVIWFGYGNISYHLMKELKRKKPDIKIICDTDSVWSRFVLRELPHETDKNRIKYIEKTGFAKQKEEKEWVDFCDITTAVSDVDAEYYQSLTENKNKVMLFSNVIDFNKYQKTWNKPSNFKTPNIYLAGSFGPKSAMDKAARWFIYGIYPLIKKDIPNIHFYIIGRGSKTTLHDIDDKSISILGKVESVLPYLANVDVSIVPLQFESGTRFKIIEAAACKVPTVSTKLGAEGIPVQHEVDILIADEEQAFADAVVRLIRNKVFAENMANNCYDLIEEHNSLKKLIKEAQMILDGVI